MAKRGLSVTVFDREEAGAQASWAGAGMLAPGGEVDLGSPIADAALQSRRLYPDFVAELTAATGRAIDFQTCGALDLAFTVPEMAALNEKAQRQDQLGVFSKPLTTAQILTFWPHIQPQGIAGGRFYPGDATVNPRELTAALLHASREHQATIHEQEPVHHIEVSDHAVLVSAGERTRHFAAAIVCAGAWSARIPVAGVPALPPVEPVKGVLLGYRQPEQTCPTIVRHGHTYLLQRSNGLLIAGASVEKAGFSREPDPAVVRRLSSEAAAILPHLGETTAAEVWTGLRPYSAELRLGRWHSNRLMLAYGHYRNGILLAPWTALTIATQLSASLGTH